MSHSFWKKLGNSDHSGSVHWESLSCSLVIGLTDKCLAVKSIRVQRNNSFSKADWAKTKTDGTLFSIRNWALLQKRNLYFQDLILPAQYSETEAIKMLKSCYICTFIIYKTFVSLYEYFCFRVYKLTKARLASSCWIIGHFLFDKTRMYIVFGLHNEVK